jgi:hypothetical protein
MLLLCVLLNYKEGVTVINNVLHQNALLKKVRTFNPKVEFYLDSTLEDTYTPADDLISFEVDRVGAGKFFGFGICQKLNVQLIDKERVKDITTAHIIKISFTVGSNTLYPFPQFIVTEVHRNENTNALSITAYDILYFSNSGQVKDLGLVAPYTVRDCAEAIADWLILDGVSIPMLIPNPFGTSYAEGANFTGNESIRTALDAIAEVTQTIYFISNENELRFRQITPAKAISAIIGKENYFELDTGENRRLSTIISATELGDNISFSTGATGTTQTVWNNPFWELREDVGTLLEYAIALVGGATINQFSCKWRGNYLLEPVDCVKIITKDSGEVTTHIINDVIKFDGALSQETAWKYEAEESEPDTNPASLGDALKQTFSKVDKANRRIELVASDVSSNAEAISSLQLTTDGIVASVQKVEEATGAALEGLNSDVATLSSKVSASITSEDVQLQIETELASGVDKVTTSTGFTFNEEGLTVAKSGSEMTTTITEDGMVVYRDQQAVLTANNVGVDATNLNATTYLIIGANSRFENYGSNRTGCFWIGG